MSAWRRRALALLPSQRRTLERASSPADVWRDVHPLALATCAQHPVDENLLGAIFAFARECGAFSGEAVSDPELCGFCAGLIDDPRLRSWLPRFVDETEFLRMERVHASRVGAERFAIFKEDFFRGLALVQEGTRLGALRAIKDDLLAASSETAREHIRGIWKRIVHILEVGETQVGLEIFLDNFDDAGVSVPPDLAARLTKLCIDWGVASQHRIVQ